MSDFNHVEKIQNSTSSGQIKWFRRPKRLATLIPGTQNESFNSHRADFAVLNGSENEESELLNILHQELQNINEGMILINASLFELIAEMKRLRGPPAEIPFPKFRERCCHEHRRNAL